MVEHHDTVLDKERLMEAVCLDSIVEENILPKIYRPCVAYLGKRPITSLYRDGPGSRLSFRRRR